jgi:hypothetical protein
LQKWGAELTVHHAHDDYWHLWRDPKERPKALGKLKECTAVVLAPGRMVCHEARDDE